jgi:hypothetical protein
VGKALQIEDLKRIIGMFPENSWYTSKVKGQYEFANQVAIGQLI